MGYALAGIFPSYGAKREKQRMGRMLRDYFGHLIAPLRERIQYLTFQRDLRLLHDVLEETPLAGRYWLRAGLLLGWAREGRVLLHDAVDADFGYLQTDRKLLLQALPSLLEAGFHTGNVFRNNAGRATEYRVLRGGARFEFFEMAESGNEFEYFLYASHCAYKEEPIQLRCRVPRHGLEKIEFIGREWYKPDRHEEQLEIMYGAWREPDPEHQYTDSGAAVERIPWSVQMAWELEQF